MDSLGRRAQLMEVLDKAMERAAKAQRDAESGQHGLFGVFQQEHEHAHNDHLPDIPEWDEHQRLAAEKEILGFFITGHPLEKYQAKLQDFQAKTTEDVAAMKQSTAKDENISIGGMLSAVRVLKSKKGDLYAQGQFEDMFGTIEMVVFPDSYRKLGEKLKLTVPVLVKAGVRVEEGANPKLLINEIQPLEEAKPRLPKAIRVRIPLDSATEQTVDELHSFFNSHRGEARVLFDVERAGDFMVIMEA